VVPDEMLMELMVANKTEELLDEEEFLEDEVEEIIEHELGHKAHEDDVSKAQSK
jgi:hypothetical protein